MGGEDAEKLLARLAALGLDEREGKLYAFLSARGPSRASEAAAATKLKRTETYRALEALMERGVVSAQLTRPVVYEAVPPETLFAQELARHEQKRAELESAREEVVRTLAEARARDAGGTSRHSYRIIQGRRAILATAETMIRDAQVGQWMVSTYVAPQNVTTANRTWQTTVRRACEGLPMRLLFMEHAGLDRVLDAFSAAAQTQVRYFDHPRPLRFTIVDEEVLVWLVTDTASGLEARDDVAMWTNAPDFVHAQRVLYESLWTRARPRLATQARVSTRP